MHFNGRLPIEIASEKTNTKIPKQNEIKSTNLNQVQISSLERTGTPRLRVHPGAHKGQENEVQKPPRFHSTCPEQGWSRASMSAKSDSAPKATQISCRQRAGTVLAGRPELHGDVRDTHLTSCACPGRPPPFMKSDDELRRQPHGASQSCTQEPHRRGTGSSSTALGQVEAVCSSQQLQHPCAPTGWWHYQEPAATCGYTTSVLCSCLSEGQIFQRCLQTRNAWWVLGAPTWTAGQPAGAAKYVEMAKSVAARPGSSDSFLRMNPTVKALRGLLQHQVLSRKTFSHQNYSMQADGALQQRRGRNVEVQGKYRVNSEGNSRGQFSSDTRAGSSSGLLGKGHVHPTVPRSHPCFTSLI